MSHGQKKKKKQRRRLCGRFDSRVRPLVTVGNPRNLCPRTRNDKTGNCFSFLGVRGEEGQGEGACVFTSFLHAFLSVHGSPQKSSTGFSGSFIGMI
jgi:hypothetical protein